MQSQKLAMGDGATSTQEKKVVCARPGRYLCRLGVMTALVLGVYWYDGITVFASADEKPQVGSTRRIRSPDLEDADLKIPQENTVPDKAERHIAPTVDEPDETQEPLVAFPANLVDEIRVHLGQLWTCRYQVSMRERAPVEEFNVGQAAVRFLLHPTGLVDQVSVISLTSTHSEVLFCIERRVRTWRFNNDLSQPSWFEDEVNLVHDRPQNGPAQGANEK